MQKITEWFTSNKLIVNVDKSTAMLLHPCQKIVNSNDNIVKIYNTTVPFSISTMFFGIHIGNNWTWNAHIKHINKNISKVVGVVFCLRIELPHRILLLIYNTLILPYLTYCCIMFFLLLHNLGVTYTSYIKKNFTTQKEALRIISNSLTHCHISQIFKNLRLLNIHQHIQYHALILMFQQ